MWVYYSLTAAVLAALVVILSKAGIQKVDPFSFQSLKLGVASRTASFEKISLVFSVLLSAIFLKD